MQMKKKPSDKQIIEDLRKKENNTGNIADALEEITGQRWWMHEEIKPIFKAKIVGRAVTVSMRPVLRHDEKIYKNYALEVIDKAGAGDILVYVMNDGANVAALGDIMGTAAKVRKVAGAVIDGAVRDVGSLEEMDFPVWSRKISPATMVGRMVSVDMQMPVNCGGVLVTPGDYLVCDLDGVVVVPKRYIAIVLNKLLKYANKEKAIIEIIKKQKSLVKAIQKINRY